MQELFEEQLDNFFHSPTIAVTDTSDFASILPLVFHVIPGVSTDEEIKETVKLLVEVMKEHFFVEKKDAKTYLTRPLLIDLTTQLASLYPTNGNEPYKTYELLFNNIEKAIDLAVKELPSPLPRVLKQFINSNVLTICRLNIKGIGVVKIFYEFKNTIKDEIGFEQDHKVPKALLIRFFDQTGLRIGPIKGRQELLKWFDLKDLIGAPERYNYQPVKYMVKGKRDVIFYPKLDDITKTHLFKQFSDLVASKEVQTHYPEVAILGQSLLFLLQGLAKEVDSKKWDTLLNDKEMCVALQTILFRLNQHLAKASVYHRQYNVFVDAIELCHCEFASLLILLEPFTTDAFKQIYRKQLHKIPEALQKFISVDSVWLTNNGMKALTGILEGVLASSGYVNPVYCNNIYFEIPIVTPSKTLDLKPVNVYVGEFHHNTSNKEYNTTFYKKEDLIKDIENLIEKNKSGPLTVAVDCTIDYFCSDDVISLLKRFEQGINSGDLNFVFFESGLKFGMFGTECYSSGGLVYMVNNGALHWKSFGSVFSKEVYQADTLATQWFSLVYKYAATHIEEYKRLIFQNARAILDAVPLSLQPKSETNQDVCISLVDKNMLTPFIEIKVPKDQETLYAIEELFREHFSEAGMDVYSPRESFAFYIPSSVRYKTNLRVKVIVDSNLSVEFNQTNLRIGVGLSPKVRSVFKGFFEKLSSLVK